MPGKKLFNRTWFAILICIAVVIPRSLSMASSHSESYDDRFHIRHGLGFLSGTIASKNLIFMDPPLGQAIIALPIVLVNLYTGYPLSEYQGDGEPISLESFALIFAAWKSILFGLGVGLAFHWCRQIYGLRSAWLVLILLTFEPNLAAHVPVPALDILGMEAILLACYHSWRFASNPTWARAIGLGATTAMAMLVKHTAAILPLVVLIMVALQWIIRPRYTRMESAQDSGTSSSTRIRMLGLAGVSGMFFLWALLLFDRTPPFFAMDDAARAWTRHPQVRQVLEKRWPAGLYGSCLIQASYRGRTGNQAYLFGQKSMGWWYYLPAVALYKVPLGIWFLLILTPLSLRAAPPRWDEWGLALPAIIWAVFLMSSRFSMGFRHFFPCYLFLIMLASRCASVPGRSWVAACLGAAIAVVSHSVWYHPNYISYVNFPRDKVYLAISDSNVDWGQSLKQIRDWLDKHPPGSRPVTLRYFGILTMGNPDERKQEVDRLIAHYLDKRVALLRPHDPLPAHGLLIVSAVPFSGLYEERDRFAPLRQRKPDSIIGDCMLVFDLDQPSAP